MIAVEPDVLASGGELAPGYTVLRLVNRGRVFDVYEVWSIERHCRCAAKVLRPDTLHETKRRRRLLEEGRLLLGLSHPHIVRGYELRERPQPVLITEALPGKTVSRLLSEKGRLSAPDVARLGEHVCSAISYLHTRGILHLDLKPGNLLASYGIVRVIDLSLARRPGRGHRGAGTHAYLAPEQAVGRFVSAATDVWGIGTVLWEGAAGRPPFRRPQDPDAYEQLERRAEPIGSMRRMPKALAAGIDACLDPEPRGRPTVRQLAELVDSFL